MYVCTSNVADAPFWLHPLTAMGLISRIVESLQFWLRLENLTWSTENA